MLHWGLLLTALGLNAAGHLARQVQLQNYAPGLSAALQRFSHRVTQRCRLEGTSGS